MKLAIALLAICYAGVAVMVFLGQRLGYARVPIVIVIALCGFGAFHALYECSRSGGESRQSRVVVRSILWFFVLGSAGGLLYQIGIRVVALLR
ncbi:MAG: hypothetical protein ACREIC_34310 [Limisphaerales bacterium]